MPPAPQPPGPHAAAAVPAPNPSTRQGPLQAGTGSTPRRHPASTGPGTSPCGWPAACPIAVKLVRQFHGAPALRPRIQQRQDLRPPQRQRHPAAVRKHRGRLVAEQLQRRDRNSRPPDILPGRTHGRRSTQGGAAVGRSQQRRRHPDRAPYHPQRVRADGVQRPGNIEHAQRRTRQRVRDGRGCAGPVVVGADQVLGGEQLHRPAGDQRLADGIGADARLGPVRTLGKLQPVRPAQRLPAAHPPQDLTVGVGEHQQVPAGTRIVGQQVLQRGHHLL